MGLRELRMIQLGIIKKCRPQDRTKKRPAREQKY